MIRAFFITTMMSALAVASPLRNFQGPTDIGGRAVGIPYQSAGIPFNEWLAQLTLCFAPFAAHILNGVPTTVMTEHSSPSWTSRINFYNPTSILWRYLMITDRRIRCKNWTAEDMAGSNAAFFVGADSSRSVIPSATTGRWDGSVDIMLRSQRWLVRRPPRSRVSLLSVSVISTLVVVAQGIQALYELVAQIKTGVPYIQGLSGVFLPLAIFSLTRLPPAMWLSTEFAYGAIDSGRPEPVILTTNTGPGMTRRLARARLRPARFGPANEDHYPEPSDSVEIDFDKQQQRVSYLEDHQDEHLPSDSIRNNEDKMQPQTYWPAVLFRLIIVLILLGFVLVGIGHLLTNKEFTGEFNAAGITEHFLYSVWVFVTLVIFVVYGVRGEADTTIIPCVASRWYLAYTLIWYAGAVAVIVLNSVQLRRTKCGLYTTYTVEEGLDDKLCAMFEA